MILIFLGADLQNSPPLNTACLRATGEHDWQIARSFLNAPAT